MVNYKQIYEEYYNTLKSGVVPVIICNNCGLSSTNLRTSCPRCNSEQLKVIGAKEGIVYSYTIIERGLPITIALLLVDLNGIRVKANYFGDKKKLKIGLKVKPRYFKQELIETLVFEPAE
jgi:uncharacterized OB-fold protein